ncbi:hypothetical protein [Allosphingosinicella sp.]|uniref:hypothetical protein n=1 Tax=Allosphingosinicella sp. TaxID=2823234 RepID=UPI00378351B4
MRKLRIVALVLGVLPLSAALAQPAPAPDLRGIWEGTVGTLPVHACFVSGETGAFGAYYYNNQLRLIGLEAVEGTAGAFREGATEEEGAAARPEARWRIEQADGGALTARWTQGSRTLPVRLQRVARPADDEEGPCASLAFHQPRLAGIHNVSTRATVDGVSYTKLSVDLRGRFPASVTTFALDGDGEAVRRLNATLGEGVNGDPPGWLDCVRGPLENFPFQGEYNESLEPAMIARRWLSVASHYDGSCGGPHPDESSTYRTFDLATGQEVNLHDWFTPAAVKVERIEGSSDVLRSLEPAFRTFLLARWHGDGECDEVVRTTDYWNIGLTRAGFVFSPDLPHVAQACVEEFTADFDRIRPWLKPEGAAAVAALRGERR